jgi:WXG100 family type VII secretion target
MPQAIGDPEELERFARSLKQFNANLNNSMSQLNGQFNHLGSTWRDQEHARFAQEFEQTMRTMRRFIQEAERHIPILQRKAKSLREYLNQR